MDDIDKQIMDAMERLKYAGPTPFQAMVRGKSQAEIDKMIEEGRIRISGFSGMPSKGNKISGPVKIYEDNWPE